jgi:2-C-methyl-D-erythritol 2,4-cyclodiphosphate synthase
VGFGFDAHRFGGDGRVLLAGVVVDESRGVLGTSDADVVAHAVADAMLGAAALGDLGTMFPPDDPGWEGADSMAMLGEVVAMVRAAGYHPSSLDVTVISESVRVSPHREAIRESLAGALAVGASQVSVKATTTDGMGFAGKDEGLAAAAVAVVVGEG